MIGRLLFVIALSFSLYGCKKPEEKICQEILEKMVIDPASLSINGTDILSGPIRKSQVDEIANLTETPRMKGVLKEIYEKDIERGEAPIQTFVTLDYTANARIGKTRGKMICRYFDSGTGSTLIGVAADGKGYSGDSLDLLFLKIGRPDGLSIIHKID